MTKEQWVHGVVKSFYDKAKNDVLIGYHFRIIKDFDTHIPRIATFWEIQLFGSTSTELAEPFDVLNKHIPLSIKRGELGRWMVLFKKTLDEKTSEHEEFLDLKNLWLTKLTFFETTFSRFFGL